MIIGTAGHIDHGKTSLVRALTGVDTDRLKEEKARGISIDLGFAYLPAPDGSVLGFVDVPGHEKFVHNMLAGAAGIDFVLLVVAADDGVMPQTREHLAIVDLLGIERGIVALTKADLASPDAARGGRDARSAARSRTTRLAGAEIVPVSTVTGEGIDELREQLFAAPQPSIGARARGRFRLAVDRSFTLAGAGTVVTGTVLSGAVAVGDRVIDQPVRTVGARALDPRAEPARPSAGRRASAARSISPATASPRMRSRAAMWCSIPTCTRRPTASMRRCACCRPRQKPISAMDAGAAASCGGRGRRAYRAARRCADRAGRRRRWCSSCSTGRSPPPPATASCCAIPRRSARSAAAGSSICARRRASAARPSGWRSLPRTRSPNRTPRWRRCSTAPPFYVDLVGFRPRPRARRRRWRRHCWSARTRSICRPPALRWRCRPTHGCASSAPCWRRWQQFHADNPDLPGIGLERLRHAARAAPAGASIRCDAARACAGR